jgi:hypothetical protein
MRFHRDRVKYQQVALLTNSIVETGLSKNAVIFIFTVWVGHKD